MRHSQTTLRETFVKMHSKVKDQVGLWVKTHGQAMVTDTPIILWFLALHSLHSLEISYIAPKRLRILCVHLLMHSANLDCIPTPCRGREPPPPSHQGSHSWGGPTESRPTLFCIPGWEGLFGNLLPLELWQHQEWGFWSHQRCPNPATIGGGGQKCP